MAFSFGAPGRIWSQGLFFVHSKYKPRDPYSNPNVHHAGGVLYRRS
jgi:hypothetical protein